MCVCVCDFGKDTFILPGMLLSSHSSVDRFTTGCERDRLPILARMYTYQPSVVVVGEGGGLVVWVVVVVGKGVLLCYMSGGGSGEGVLLYELASKEVS